MGCARTKADPDYMRLRGVNPLGLSYTAHATSRAQRMLAPSPGTSSTDGKCLPFDLWSGEDPSAPG